MKLFKVPKQRPTNLHKPRPTKIVGIIDSSGSMADAWPLVAENWNKYVAPDNAYTITFDHNPHLCRTNILENSVKSHGGGKTNLVKVFKKFETKLEGLAADSNLTILFISDGEDNVSTDLDKEILELEGAKPGMCINFLCLGIGSGFPTFLSMYLREKYHTGSPTIPAIFLIEYVSAKAFLNKFESMKQYFTFGDTLTIMPPVMQYPWEKPVEAVYENTWVISESSVVDLEGTVYDLSDDKVDLEGAVGIFKGWLQRLHLESLKPGHGDIKAMAQETLKMMQVVADQVKKERGVDILNARIEDEDAENLTFHQRVMRNLIKNSLSRAAWYFEEVKVLAEGKSPKEIDKFEAAKRIGIGTIVGKYHQKALALKGITVSDFRDLRDVFADTFKETKLSPNSSQEGSVVTLQNQKEVFLEPNFLEALMLCNNQFDLVESFPVIGLAIKIKRFSGSMVNPWLTKVEFIARHHKVVDSISVVKSNNNLQLKIGENGIEAVNAVLPVFEEEDQDMKPLLRSKLYHLLMNFNVSQNVDTLYEDAYLALLSNTLVYLLTMPDSDWKKELLEKIYTTVKLVYYDDSSFIKYREGLLKDPVMTISEDEEQKKYGNMDLSKAALHVFTLFKDGKTDKLQVQNIINVIIAWFFYYTVKDPKFKIDAYCKCKLIAGGHKQVVDLVKKDFRHFYTVKDLKKETYEVFDKVLAREGKFEPFWDLKGFKKADAKINMENIERLSDMVTGRPPNKEELITWLARTYVAESFQQVFSQQMLTKPLESITRTIGKQILIDTQKDAIKKLSASQAAIDELTAEFKKWFKSLHSEVIPMTKDELMTQCGVKMVPYKELKFDQANGLVKNACLAKNCPHYLRPDKNFGLHLKIWEAEIPPAFHLTVMQFAGLSAEEIYERFVTGKGMKNNDGTFMYDAEKFGKDEEEVIRYITRIRTKMLDIKG